MWEKGYDSNLIKLLFLQWFLLLQQGCKHRHSTKLNIYILMLHLELSKQNMNWLKPKTQAKALVCLCFLPVHNQDLRKNWFLL